MIHTDLHIHTNYSCDAEFSPEEIVDRCLTRGINLFSVTDHNGVKGVNEAAQLAERNQINFISGIEIDCIYHSIDLHLLGYNINQQSNDFAELEKEIFSKVMNSFDEMTHNLHRLGFVIDAQAVLDRCNGQLPSPEMFAEVMLSDPKYYSPLLLPYMKGGNRSESPYINFYLDYFEQGKPAFVQLDFMSYKDAIEMVKDNGGTPIVAHPGRNLANKEEVILQLLDNGAQGMEVFNNYHNDEQIAYFASVAQQRKAIMTCGSDFHGRNKPLINIGQFKFENRYGDYLNNSIQRLKKDFFRN